MNSSQGGLVGLEFKQEVSRAEMSAEENNVDASEKRTQGFKNKVGAFDVWYNFLKEIMFNYSSDPSTILWYVGGFSILKSIATTKSNGFF